MKKLCVLHVRRGGIFFSLFTTVLLTGCSHIAYYAQAIHGQSEISTKAESIVDVLADPATDPRIIKKLQLVQQARVFASAELGLPDNGTFQSYANLQRPFVVWNVFAAPAYSVEPVTHCFPIAGCVAYRGYFSEDAARAAGKGLQDQGLDVFVSGIPIYSTLGWFDDPVLNTFIGYPEPDLVGIIFHELAHQVVYVPGDSVFNESFATAVEEAGVKRWFERAQNPQAYSKWQAVQQRKREFTALLVRTRDRLAQAYAQQLDETQQQKSKTAIIVQATTEYAALKQGWGGYAGYDKWYFDTPLNNAKLVSATLYADRVPAFAALLKQHGGDFPSFYTAVRELATLPEAERTARLDALQAVKVATVAE